LRATKELNVIFVGGPPNVFSVWLVLVPAGFDSWSLLMDRGVFISFPHFLQATAFRWRWCSSYCLRPNTSFTVMSRVTSCIFHWCKSSPAENS